MTCCKAVTAGTWELLLLIKVNELPNFAVKSDKRTALCENVKYIIKFDGERGYLNYNNHQSQVSAFFLSFTIADLCRVYTYWFWRPGTKLDVCENGFPSFSYFMPVILSRLSIFINYKSRDLDNIKILLYKLFVRYLVVKPACVNVVLEEISQGSILDCIWQLQFTINNKKVGSNHNRSCFCIPWDLYETYTN